MTAVEKRARTNEKKNAAKVREIYLRIEREHQDAAAYQAEEVKILTEIFCLKQQHAKAVARLRALQRKGSIG